jgi:tetratricopeptide (TPR) repeat protein
MSLIETLQAHDINEEREKEIIELNEESIAMAEQLNLNKVFLYDFAYFLRKQKKYDYAIKVAEKLKLYYQADKNVSDYYKSTLLNLIANLYYEEKNFNEAEKYYLETLGINKKLASENPIKYNPDLVVSLYNLAKLYSDSIKAKEYYNEALSIYKELVKENPSKYESDDLGVSLYSLANFYNNIKRNNVQNWISSNNHISHDITSSGNLSIYYINGKAYVFEQ